MGGRESHHKGKREEQGAVREKDHFGASFLQERIPAVKGKTLAEIVDIFKKYGIEFPEKELIVEFRDFGKRFDEFIKWLAGKMNPVIADGTQDFINWADTQSIKSYYCSPRTKDDIIKILTHPDYEGKHIGLLGSTHSWDNLYGEDNCVLLNFTLFNCFGENEKRVRVDKAECTINISAGCSILEKHGLLGISDDPMLLPSCVIYTDGHYAGISATGCHGCSFTDGSLSDRIRKITFLDSNGKEEVLDINKDEKKLRAAAIGLGSFGIITELQFKMVPEMLVVTESHYWTLSQMKYHLINRPSDWISFEHYWWPFGSVSLADAFQCTITGTLTNYDYQEDKVYCRIVRHYRDPKDFTDLETNKVKPHWDENSKTYIYPDPEYTHDPNSPWDNEFPYYLQEVMLWLRKYVFINFEHPSVDPGKFEYLQRFVPFFQVIVLEVMKILQFLQEFGRPRVTTFFNAVHYLPFVSALPMRVNDIELCFRASSQPAGVGERENFDNYIQALNELGVRIQDEAYYGRFPVNLVVESRICAASPCPLAACYSTKDELFCYLEVVSFLNTPSWNNFSNEFFKVIKSIDSTVKPSLGKQWVQIDGIYEHLREVCGVGLIELKKLQQQYDPKGRFMTPAIVKLFENF